MARLAAIETPLLHHRDPIIIAERVDHGRTHTARRRRARDDHGITAQLRQMARHRRAEEPRRLQFVNHEVLRRRRELIDDGVSVAIALRRFLAAGVLARPAAGIPHIGTARAGRIDHRQLALMSLVDQPADLGDRRPGLRAAGIPPALDRLQDVLARIVAREGIADIDDEKRRPLAEAPRNARRNRRPKTRPCHGRSEIYSRSAQPSLHLLRHRLDGPLLQARVTRRVFAALAIPLFLPHRVGFIVIAAHLPKARPVIRGETRSGSPISRSSINTNRG